jgi:hypothetical protein
MDGKTKALLCVQEALAHKAQDLVLLDIKETVLCGFFLICVVGPVARCSVPIVSRRRCGKRGHVRWELKAGARATGS